MIKNSDLLPLESLFLMGLNSTLSSFSQNRSGKKGGNVGSFPGNRLLATDHDLTGFSDPRSNWAFSDLVVCL